MFSQLNLLKMSCIFSPLLPPRQLFWALWQASNLKWAHLVDQSVTFLSLNICYVLCSIVNKILAHVTWSFSFHFIQIKKTSQLFRNSGCKIFFVVIKTDLSQQQPLKWLKMHYIKQWGNNDWLIIMVSLNNTVKIHNVIQNKCMCITCYYKCLPGEPKAW